MKINKALFNVIFLYSSISLVVIIALCIVGGLQSFELHFLFITFICLILLMVWCIVKFAFGLQDEIFDKSLPAKITLPISKITLYKFEYFFGFTLFIIAILSIPLTWVIWLGALVISLIWVSFFYHRNVWANDSIDFGDRMRNPEKYKITHPNGVFEYPENFDGFYYFYRRGMDENNHDVYQVLWSDILSIDATYLDQFTFQEIRLYLLTENSVFEIDESTDGYLKFFEQLQDHLEGFESLKMLAFMSGDFSGSINVYKKNE